MALAPRGWDEAGSAVKNAVSPPTYALREPFMAPDAQLELFVWTIGSECLVSVCVRACCCSKDSGHFICIRLVNLIVASLCEIFPVLLKKSVLHDI